MAAHLRLVTIDDAPVALPRPPVLKQVAHVFRLCGSAIAPAPRALGHLAGRAALVVLPSPSPSSTTIVRVLPVPLAPSCSVAHEGLRLVR